MKKAYLTFLFLFIFLPSVTLAHPGRTDSSGCHTCRTNCAKWGLSTGEYHCHRAKTLPQPKEPIKSHFSETGGYITPAPEYKQPATNIKKAVTTTAEVKPVVKQVEVKSTAKQAEVKVSESWFTKLVRFLFK